MPRHYSYDREANACVFHPPQGGGNPKRAIRTRRLILTAVYGPIARHSPLLTHPDH